MQRRGRKKLPIYKIVAADSRSPRDGRFIEAIGQYKPLTVPAELEIDKERALYWLGVGAQPSDTVRSLLSDQGIMLHFHLLRKGKSEDEIAQELEAWQKAKDERKAKTVSKKQLRAQRRAEAEAKAKAEEEAKAKAEAEAKAKEEAEAAAAAAAEAPAEEAPAEEAAADDAAEEKAE
ncbi:30S ribosomal protein S16 [bacterium]|nr:30S ribosomal protein S16 [bacterium]